MSYDLSSLTVEELHELIEEAKSYIIAKKEQAVQKAYVQMVQLATALGMSVEDVLARGRKTAPKTKEEKAVKRVAPKYRNPLNADETWTGRGKPPRWVQEKISRGITLEDMLIK